MKYRLLLIMITIFHCYTAISQTADFTYIPSSGSFCSPQTFTFTQTSSGTPSSFIWNFGNGQSGNRSVETITYTQAGTYTVSLIVVYNNVAVTVNKNITVNETPFITVTADRYSLCQPGIVNFTASGSSSLSSFEWDFGDGSPLQTTSSNTVSHNYMNYGNYSVFVKGITSAGCFNTTSSNIAVAKFPLSATVNPTKGCIPITATFQVIASMVPGDSPQSILWEWGDGTPQETNNFTTYTHAYNTTADITTAKIIVTTTQGCTNDYTFPKFAFGTPPTGINAYTVSGRDTFCGSETIDLYASANNANLYTWDFGGVIQTSTTNNISYKFLSLGSKNVVVTPSFNGCDGAKDTVNIFINGVIASYTIQNTCSQKNRFTFSNNSIGNISHFEWTFSDIPSFIDSTNFNATHTFPSSGSFNTNLLLIDYLTGCRDSLRKSIFTTVPSFTADKNSVCKDSLIIYTVNNPYPMGTGYNYEFHVNGQVIPNGDGPVLYSTPAAHGLFNDYVVITDNTPGTCNDTLYLSGSTRVKGPVADFSIPSRICSDTAVSIINNSYSFYNNEPITKWSWDFGDGKKDSVGNPAPHLYISSGFFPIVMTVTDLNGCGNKLSKSVQILPLPQINILPGLDTLCSGQSIQLIGYSTDSITWSPSTNINCTNCDTVIVSPRVSTNYIGKAINTYGCKKSDTSYIKVYEPFFLKVSPSDTSVCAGMPVQFNLNKNGITTWSPSTYLSNSNIINPVATPQSSINYKIIVQDSVGCFTDSTVAKIFVFPKTTVDAGPDIFLDYDKPFTLSPVYSAGISRYLWTPSGNLSCTNCANPSGKAEATIKYKIQVTSNNGCLAEDSITIYLNCINSKIFFPSAFTPNGDRKNDYFYPMAFGYEEIKSFTIFNRYGFKVFERQNFKPNIPSLGWDGRIREENQSSTQTFVWFAEIVCEGKTLVKKGVVTLIR